MIVRALVLLVGMGIIGIRLLSIVLIPLGLLAERFVHPANLWYWGMAAAQISAFATTLVLGLTAADLPWYAALIVALLIAMTTYTSRPADDGYDLFSTPSERWDDD